MKVISEAERRAGRDDVSRRSFSEGRSLDELFVTNAAIRFFFD